MNRICLNSPSFKAKVASIAKNKQLKLITGHDVKNSKCGDVYRTVIRHALFLLRFVYRPVIIFKRTNFQLYKGNRCNRPFFCLFRRISWLLQKLRVKDPGALIGYVMVQIMQGNTLFLCIIYTFFLFVFLKKDDAQKVIVEIARWETIWPYDHMTIFWQGLASTERGHHPFENLKKKLKYVVLVSYQNLALVNRKC